MIVTVSRRTDVPAFHFEWFMNRVRAGYAMVRNPVFPGKVSKIPLSPSDVDMFVFISKNPAPSVPYLKELADMGYGISFQVTVNSYGKDIEPNVPDRSGVIDSVKRISDIIGPDRTLWRYDPVIFSGKYDMDFHAENFERTASELEGHVGRCIFSFLDVYDKHASLFRSEALREAAPEEKFLFAKTAASIAEKHGIELSNCCGEDDFSEFGIRNRGCIDAESFRRWGVPYDRERSTIREGCMCVRSADIGAYDTCMHGCIYCYANRTDPAARSGRSYDPDSEMLYGTVRPGDEIREMRGRDSARLSDYL